MNREQWCGKMCEQIRFRPDRSAVWEEMKGHLDDKRDALVASGLSLQDAETAAVAAMGDPEEVGRQMNAVHKPWLGWLWKLSGWVLAAAILFGMFSAGAAMVDGNREGESVYTEFLDPMQTVYTDYDGARWTRLLYEDEDLEKGKWGRYTFRMEKTAVWDAVEGLRLYAEMKVGGFLPWEPALVLRRLYAVDDLGNRYDLMRDGAESWLSAYSNRGGIFSRSYDVQIKGLCPEAQWVELRIDDEMTLRVELREGGEP